MTATTIRRNTRAASRKKTVQASKTRVYATMALSGAIVVSGFFLAATQHFSFMDFSIKNSRLRRQIDELEAEKRRLLVYREVSLSPAEIRKAADRAALLAAAGSTAQQINIGKPNVAAKVVNDKKPVETATTAATIVKTTFVRPAAQPLPPVQAVKRPIGESERRRTVTAAE